MPRLKGKLPPLPPKDQSGTTIKNYKLGEIIGKGNNGKVYKTLNMDTGDVVAIKQIPLHNMAKEEISSMMKEIELLNHLDHANIVKYLASIKTKDYLNIVLEYVENGSLANTVKKFGSLPESLIAIYIEQVLQGLHYLHTQGVIHRDIKGANILTTKEGTVKLADFGVATRMGDATALPGKDYHDVAGTPYWMAPEVIEMSPASPASDIWSVGATIIELLTGSPPYFDLAAMPALFRIVQDPCPPLPKDMSPALDDFLKLCFRKDPSTRLTAKQLLDHKWITLVVARRQSISGELAPNHAGDVTRGQNWTEVVERTLELHEAAQRDKKTRGTRAVGTNAIMANRKLSWTPEGPDGSAAHYASMRSNLTGSHISNSSLTTRGGGDGYNRHEQYGARASKFARRRPRAYNVTFPRPQDNLSSSALEALVEGRNKYRRAVGLPPVAQEGDSQGMAEEDCNVPEAQEHSSTAVPANEGATRASENGTPAQLHESRGIELSSETLGGTSRSGARGNPPQGETKVTKKPNMDKSIQQWFEDDEEALDWGKDLVGPPTSSSVDPDSVLLQLQLRHVTNTGDIDIETEADWGDDDAQSFDAGKGLERAEKEIAAPAMSDNIMNVQHSKITGSSLHHYSETGDETDNLDLSDLELPSSLTAKSKIPRPQVIRPEDLEKIHNYNAMGSLSASSSWQSRMGKYMENQTDNELLDLDMEDSNEDLVHVEGFQSVLQRRLYVNQRLQKTESVDEEDEEDPFSDIEWINDEEASQPDLFQGRRFELVEAEMLQLCNQLSPEGGEVEQCEICQSLEQLLRYHGEIKHSLIIHHQVLPLLEMLDSPSSLVVCRILRVIHEAITERERRNAAGDYTGVIGIISPVVDNMLTVGLAHRLLALCSLNLSNDSAAQIVQQAALVLNSLCWGAEPRHVQMIVACQGIPVLVGLLAAEPPLNHVALDCIWKVINLPPPTPKTDFCRLLARVEAAARLVALLRRPFIEHRNRNQQTQNEANGWVDLSELHAERIASIVVLFSQADKVVKADMAKMKVLEVLLPILEAGAEGLSRVLEGAYLKLLKALRHLSGDTNSLVPLQQAGCVTVLVKLLSRSATKMGSKQTRISSEVQSQVMFALYNLCKLSKVRQEQAAAAGVIVHLQRLIKSNSPLRQLAIPLLCDLAHAGDEARRHLWLNNGLSFYLEILQMKYWHHVALNCVAVWLSSSKDANSLEDVLLQPQAMQVLVKSVADCDVGSASNLFPPLLRILQYKRLNRKLGESDMVDELLKRLDHPEAVVRKVVLQIIQVMYEKSEDPRVFITKHDLINLLEKLVEQDQSKVVSGQAKVLLKAMMVNNVI